MAISIPIDVYGELTKELASKADLLVLKSELEKKIEVEIAKIKVEISNVKAEIIKWMFLFWIGQLASLIAILKFFKF
jgi:hypothetical protein